MAGKCIPDCNALDLYRCVVHGNGVYSATRENSKEMSVGTANDIPEGYSFFCGNNWDGDKTINVISYLAEFNFN